MSQFLLYNVKELILNKLYQQILQDTMHYIHQNVLLKIKELYKRIIFNRTLKINFIQKFVKRNSRENAQFYGTPRG